MSQRSVAFKRKSLQETENFKKARKVDGRTPGEATDMKIAVIKSGHTTKPSNLKLNKHCTATKKKTIETDSFLPFWEGCKQH